MREIDANRFTEGRNYSKRSFAEGKRVDQNLLTGIKDNFSRDVWRMR